MAWFFLVAGAVLVLGLAVYASMLWREVFKQRQEQEQAEQEAVQKAAAHRQYLLDSIETIARVLVDDQANITECAIRLRVLLENLYPNACPRPEFRPIYELAWATSHMPILDQRKEYSKKEIRAFDKEREALEAKMGDEVRDAASKLIGYNFDS